MNWFNIAIYIVVFLIIVKILQKIFSKRSKAKKQEEKLEKSLSLLEKLGIGVPGEKRVLRTINRLIEKNPRKALRKTKKAENQVYGELFAHVDELISETEKIIKRVLSKKIASPSDAGLLRSAIGKSQDLLTKAKDAEQRKDFETAVRLANLGNRTMKLALQRLGVSIERRGKAA